MFKKKAPELPAQFPYTRNLISNPDPKTNPSPITLLAALTNPSDYPFGTELYGK